MKPILEKLAIMLAHPHPGLFTWHEAIGELFAELEKEEKMKNGDWKERMVEYNARFEAAKKLIRFKLSVVIGERWYVFLLDMHYRALRKVELQNGDLEAFHDLAGSEITGSERTLALEHIACDETPDDVNRLGI